MPPALPVTSTSSFPAVTDLCFSALKMPSTFGLPSATIEIQESSVALTEMVKACLETGVESEDEESEDEESEDEESEDPGRVVESLAAVSGAVLESLLEVAGAEEAGL